MFYPIIVTEIIFQRESVKNSNLVRFQRNHTVKYLKRFGLAFDGLKKDF